MSSVLSTNDLDFWFSAVISCLLLALVWVFVMVMAYRHESPKRYYTSGKDGKPEVVVRSSPKKSGMVARLVGNEA